MLYNSKRGISVDINEIPRLLFDLLCGAPAVYAKCWLAGSLAIGTLAGCSSASDSRDSSPQQAPDLRLLASIWVILKASRATGEPIEAVMQLAETGQPARLHFDSDFYRQWDSGLQFERAYTYSVDELRLDSGKTGGPVLGVECAESFQQIRSLLD